MNFLAKQVYTFFVLCSAILIVTSCSSKKDDKISEGKIIYSITYPDMDKENIMASMMPTRMTMYFKDNKFKTEISSGMGIFKTNFICDANELSYAHLIKLLDKKYSVKLDKKGVEELNKEFPVFHIEPTNTKKKIAGYLCDKAIIKVPGDSANTEFTVYSTEDINIEASNWCTQFAEIEGVLLEYQVKRFDILMRFKAMEVVAEPVSDADLEIPEEYVEIDRDTMESKINAIFENFK